MKTREPLRYTHVRNRSLHVILNMSIFHFFSNLVPVKHRLNLWTYRKSKHSYGINFEPLICHGSQDFVRHAETHMIFLTSVGPMIMIQTIDPLWNIENKYCFKYQPLIRCRSRENDEKPRTIGNT